MAPYTRVRGGHLDRTVADPFPPVRRYSAPVESPDGADPRPAPSGASNPGQPGPSQQQRVLQQHSVGCPSCWELARQSVSLSAETTVHYSEPWAVAGRITDETLAAWRSENSILDDVALFQSGHPLTGLKFR